VSLGYKNVSFNKARQYAFLLLKFRPRSSKEIAQRLKKKDFDQKTIKEITLYLEEKGFLNDREFTRAWIESRLKRRFGFNRIRRELGIKGIDKQIIDLETQEIKKRYSEEDSLIQLAEERWRKLSGIPTQKAKQRLFGYLTRRGFSPEIIIETVNKLLK